MSQGNEKDFQTLCSAERSADKAAAAGDAVNGSSEVGRGNLKSSGPTQCPCTKGQ